MEQTKGGNKNSIRLNTGEFKLLLTQGAWSVCGTSVSFCYYFCYLFLYSFYHGKLGMMGNLAGWKHCKDARSVGYLPDRSSHAMNKNARVKLHRYGAKLCICSAWFLVHLPSMGSRSII
jgi:hypothetical protein